jgi:hypothetical protein
MVLLIEKSVEGTELSTYVDSCFSNPQKEGFVAAKHRVPIQSLRIMGEKAYGLTPKQEQFALVFATENVTQTEAARRAGFSNPSWSASRLLNGRDFPHVLRRVVELKHELSRRFEVTFENHVKKLAEIRDLALADKQYASAVAAEKNRGQVAGLYIARHEVLIGKIDQMSREEVMSEIRKLQEEFPALADSASMKHLVEDVTFEELLPEPPPPEPKVGHEQDGEDAGDRSGRVEKPERRYFPPRTLDKD